MTNVDVRVGDAVVYVDQLGHGRPALVTAVHGWGSVEQRAAALDARPRPEYYSEASWAEHIAAAKSAPLLVPSINVVYVEFDEKKTDPYGRQIARASSVSHQSSQTAHGFYWFK